MLTKAAIIWSNYYNLNELFYICILFIIWIYFKMNFIPVIKTEFSASLLQSSVSRDSSEIILIYWFTTQDTFHIIIDVEKRWLIFLWKLW